MSGGILLIAEHNGKTLSPTFAKVLSAAQKLGGALTVVVAGQGVASIVAEVKAFSGIKCIVHLEGPMFARPTPEVWVENLAPLVEGQSHIIAAASTYSRGFLGRLAARFGGVMLSDVLEVKSPTQFVRPIYAGALCAEVEVNAQLIVFGVRASAFEAAGKNGEASAEVVEVTPVAAGVQSESVHLEETVSTRPELGTASVVVSGGRGMGTKEDFALIEKLADKLGAAVGASRAAVDAGFAPNDLQVGQTGKVVAPNVYFAIGISGAVQHLAGIKGAKIIVAINKDANAPIFNVADYSIVGDLFAVVPELIEKL